MKICLPNSRQTVTGTSLCLAGELREKYGDAIPLETAALLELVELGKRYFNFLDAENLDYSFGGDDLEDDDWEID